MKVVFVDNLLVSHAGGVPRYDLQPHLGLLSLIAVTEDAGHDAVLIDPKLALHRGELRIDASLYRDLAALILAETPDVVGMTSLGCNFVCTLKVAQYLKEARPDLPIVLGGPHATILDEPILRRYPCFDVVVRHEGEFALPALLDALRQGCAPAQVPGITYRARDGHGDGLRVNPGAPLIDDLGTLPEVDYGHYPVNGLGLSFLRLEAGRGCPFECTFCSTATFFGRRYRLKAAERLVGEMQELRTRFGISEFALNHDLFTVNRDKVRAFCDAVAGKGFRWSCSARTDCVDAALLTDMRRAGCHAIYYGIETGSVRMQRHTRKKLKLDGTLPIIATTLKLGISATASFITGYPDETAGDQDATLDMIGALYRHDSAALNIQLHLLTPEPGTELMNASGAGLSYDGHVTDFNFPTLEPDDAEVMRAAPEIFVNHHYFPTVTDRRKNIFVTDFLPNLHAIGFPILEQLVARSEGRLSVLIDRLWRWKCTHAVEGDEFELLTRFAEETFGRRDVLAAVVRYAAVGARLLQNDRGRQAPPAGEAAGRLRLARSAALLHDLPDVPAILAEIDAARSAGETLALDGQWPDAGHWLLSADDEAHRCLRNFRLDPPQADFLSYLQTPRTLAECRSRLAGVTDDGEIDALLGHLVAQRLVEVEANANANAR